MRLAMVGFAACLLLWSGASAAHPTAGAPEKAIRKSLGCRLDRVGGEDIASAVWIGSLPFADTGTTCGYVDDYDEACPYEGSTSPDVVYALSVETDLCASISLCGSLYDTKVYVYADEWTPGNAVACNDDNYDCDDPPESYTSWIESVQLLTGHVYYIVIDGYGGECGDYSMTIHAVECPCTVTCPEGSVAETEPNYGCSGGSEPFSEPPPSEDTVFVCGGCYVVGARDTDWHLLHLPRDEMEIAASVVAEFPVILGFIDLRSGCPVTDFYSYATAPECETASLCEVLPAGDWVIFVAPSEWWVPYYNAPYVLTIDGYDSSVPVRAMSWSAVKALFR